jgi:hypothetical protein
VRTLIFAVGLVIALVMAPAMMMTSANVAAPRAMAAPAPASAADACALLTPEQISEVVGAKVGTGTNPAPGFTKTCTWVTKGIIVTLMLEGADAFQKQKTSPMPGMDLTPASGVGDDAFYVTLSTNVSLFAKKGSSAFKATVYCSTFSMDKKKGMEKALAQQVVSKL